MKLRWLGNYSNIRIQARYWYTWRRQRRLPSYRYEVGGEMPVLVPPNWKAEPTCQKCPTCRSPPAWRRAEDSAITRLRQWDGDFDHLSTCRREMVGSCSLCSQLFILVHSRLYIEMDINRIRAGHQARLEVESRCK